MTSKEDLPEDVEAAGDPTSTAPEQNDEDERPPSWCKRNSRRIYAVLGVLFVAAVVAISVGLTRGSGDGDDVPPYQDLIQEFELQPDSSDEMIQQAIFAMNKVYSTRCKAGWVLAVTRNKRRIIVPEGVLKTGETTRITEDTLFEIGSISKPITGLVLAHQVVKGLVTLDTPLNDRLPDSIPDLIVKGSLATFGQLVTHTAGFPRLSKNVRERDWTWLKDNPYGGYTEEDLLREIEIATGELSQTGNVEYSNFGFSVLGYLLGKNENTSFPELQKALTDRLGMNNTWIETIPQMELAHLSTGYLRSSPTPYWYDGGLFINGAGSTVSSARDLCRRVETLMSPDTTIEGDDDLIDALKLSLMPLKETSPENGVAYSWFYGAYNETDTEKAIYAHTGGTAGFNSYAKFQPGSQTGIIGMTNCGHLPTDIVAMGEALASKLLVL